MGFSANCDDGAVECIPRISYGPRGKDEPAHGSLDQVSWAMPDPPRTAAYVIFLLPFPCVPGGRCRRSLDMPLSFLELVRVELPVAVPVDSDGSAIFREFVRGYRSQRGYTFLVAVSDNSLSINVPYCISASLVKGLEVACKAEARVF